MSVHVRPATGQDIDAVVVVEGACSEAPHWKRAQYANSIQEQDGAMPRQMLLVGEASGRIVGFVVASAAAGQAELESVAVLPEARRQGIGRRLSEAAIQWARSSGAEQMLLEVRSRNSAAQAMYTRLGFEKVGLRPGYYSHPSDDAVLMASNLLAVSNL